MTGMLAELKRRNIFRVGSVYGIVGWLIIQLGIALETSLNLPGWFDTILTTLVLIGFPIAMVLAWAFEMTPDGVKRTTSVKPSESLATETGQQLNRALAVALGVALCFIIFDSIRPRMGSGERTVRTVYAGEASIAVLPFADLSPEGDQAYFSDGISEELLNVLAQVPDLQVAGRTSSFAFKGRNEDIRKIGELLDVAHILEGSVRKSGQKIRVNAQLNKVADGFQIWSSTYDGDLSDIFKVQDEISQAILTELMPQLLGKNSAVSETIKSKPAAMDVYDLYLVSKQHARGGTFEDYRAAAKALDRALVTDPNYVPALAWRGFYEIMLSDAPGFQGDTPLNIASERAIQWIEKAIALDSNSADALFARATLYSTRAETKSKAERDYRRALEIKPNFPIAKNDLAVLLESEFKFEEAFELFKEALSHDPALVDANFNLFQGYFWLSRFDDAQSVLDNWARISPQDQTRKRLEANFAFDTGQLAKGMTLARALNAETPDTPLLERFITVAYFELGEYEAVLKSPYRELEPFALYRLGQKDEAVALAEKLIKDRPNFVSTQKSYINFLFMRGDWSALAAYYDATYSTVDTFSQSDAYPPFEQMAAALIAQNHPQAKMLLSAGRAHIDRQRESRISLSILDIEEATQFILEEKFELALDRLETAYSKGSYDMGLMINPVFSRLQDRPRFKQLKSNIEVAVNREREKLDLPPTQMPL